MLQVYCCTYKQAPLTPHGLLQRACQLDQLLPATVSDGSKSLNEVKNYTCEKCKTSIAPCFYNERNPMSGENVRMCHRSYYRKKLQSKYVGFCDSLMYIIYIDPCLISAQTLTNYNSRTIYWSLFHYFKESFHMSIKFCSFFLLLCTNKQTDEKCTNLVIQRKNPGLA